MPAYKKIMNGTSLLGCFVSHNANGYVIHRTAPSNPAACPNMTLPKQNNRRETSAIPIRLTSIEPVSSLTCNQLQSLNMPAKTKGYPGGNLVGRVPSSVTPFP